MKCPKCKATLKRIEREDVTVDSCELCYGIWLDKGELEKINSYKDGQIKDSQEVIKKILGSESEVIEKKSFNCPSCNKIMEKIKFATPDNVVADKCSACEGIWFDSGELISVSDTVELEKIKGKDSKKEKKISLLPSILAIMLVMCLFVMFSIMILNVFK